MMVSERGTLQKWRESYFERLYTVHCSTPKLKTRGANFIGAFRKIAEKLLLDSSRLSVPPWDRMEQLGSHWEDFHEI